VRERLRGVLRFAAFVALLGTAATACQAQPPYERVHPATFQLTVEGGTCSGFAVKHNVIATAGHCVSWGTTTVMVEGQGLCEIRAIIRDTTDHVFLRVTGCTFKHVVKFGPAPKQGDEVFLWSAPFGIRQLLIFGRVAGWMPGELVNAQTTLYDLNGFSGSSGGPIFNMQGQVVAIVSIGTRPYKLMGSFPFTWTRAQWRQAGLA